MQPECTTSHIRMPTRGPGTSTFRKSSTRMTLGIKTCFSLVLRVDLFLLLNVGPWIRLFLYTRFSHYADLHKFHGSLLSVVVLSDFYSRFLFVSICPVSCTCSYRYGSPLVCSLDFRIRAFQFPCHRRWIQTAVVRNPGRRKAKITKGRVEVVSAVNYPTSLPRIQPDQKDTPDRPLQVEVRLWARVGREPRPWLWTRPLEVQHPRIERVSCLSRSGRRVRW